MVITRAQFESVMVRRRGKQLALVSLDGTTADGTNADLADPLAVALGSLGVIPADPTNPADSDLAAVDGTSWPQLVDVGELRTLETIVGNWTECDEQGGADKQELGKFLGQLQAALESLRGRCESLYGFGARGLTAGTINLGTAETLDDGGCW